MIPRYSRPEMTAIWSDEGRFALWLEIELAAMEAMVKEGLVPAAALASAKKNAGFDTSRILEIEKEVKHDVIAFLTSVSEKIGEGSEYLHFGMTSSDLLDTAFSVQLKRAGSLLSEKLELLRKAVYDLATAQKDTLCIGRSHGIHAEPTTFGLKVLGWYTELTRGHERLLSAIEDISVGAISGPVGTYSLLPLSIEEHVCKSFGLKSEPVSTQVISRDHHASFFSVLATIASSIERIAVEVRHLQRTELREVEEAFTRGQKGSSAMPHKRNPILSENLTGLARLVRSYAGTSLENVALWHERDISHSSVERVIAPDATTLLHFMLHRATGLVENLVVYPKNMQKNLDITRGLFASASLLVSLSGAGMKRESAYTLVQSIALRVWDSAGELDFKEEVLKEEKISGLLSSEHIDDLFNERLKLKRVADVFERVGGYQAVHTSL